VAANNSPFQIRFLGSTFFASKAKRSTIEDLLFIFARALTTQHFQMKERKESVCFALAD
jgi:hypothetical protein